MKLLRASEVMIKLSVSRGKVYQMIKKGVIPSVYIDGCVRVPEQAIDELICRQLKQQAGYDGAKIEDLHVLFGGRAERR